MRYLIFLLVALSVSNRSYADVIDKANVDETKHITDLQNCRPSTYEQTREIAGQKVSHRHYAPYIKEFSSKKSIPMNLLAPIGYGSKNPNFLPLFFMYNFDFIRKKYTQIECKIEDKKIEIDKFSMPMNMQFRYYARYSNQCELLEKT